MKLSSIISYIKRNLLAIILLIALSYLFLENNTLKTEIKLIKAEIGNDRTKVKKQHYRYGSGILGRIGNCESRISDLESTIEEINESVANLTYKKRKPIHTIDLDQVESSLKELGGENTK